MEPRPASYRAYGGGPAKNMEIVTVKKGNGNANVGSMFVSHSQPRPLNIPSFPNPHARKAKKESSSWWSDPEMKRRRRVAKYKFYAAEGKFKASIKHGFRWIKHKCSGIARRFRTSTRKTRA